MNVVRRLTLLILPLIALNALAQTATSNIDKSLFQERFGKLGLQVTEVTPSEIDGMVEVQTTEGVLFASPDASHFIAGKLFRLDEKGSYVDVIAQRQAPINAGKIAQMRNEMIEFKADTEKYAVTVFTDITCGYCVRLHSQLKEYNDLGITIRYLAFPRQGPSGDVANEMAAIWCSDDPKSALHNAKIKREKIESSSSKIAQCRKEITDQYMLGRELGVGGTPAIFMPDGEMIGGYLPAPQLLQRLKEQL